MKLKNFLSLLSVFLFFNVVNIFAKYSKILPFYDLTTLKKSERKARSPIIQFYCRSNNLGDYLPVLGIKQMIYENIGLETDTHAMRFKKENESEKTIDVDFDFINKNYKIMIIGGAGLFHKVFNDFWKQTLEKCKLPIIIWGVGLCLPETIEEWNGGSDKAIIQSIAKKCELINLRDSFSAHYYGIENAHVSLCPSVIFIRNFLSQKINHKKNAIFYSSHKRLVPKQDNKKIIQITKNNAQKTLVNSHMYKKINTKNLDHLLNSYCQSNIVVTTRLHGAIIAYTLEIPYIMIAYDQKLRAFHEEYGNGVLLENIEQLDQAIKDKNSIEIKPLALQPVLDFGHAACNVIKKYCS